MIWEDCCLGSMNHFFPYQYLQTTITVFHSCVSLLQSCQHIFPSTVSEFGISEFQPSSSGLFMTLPPQETFQFLISVLYSLPSHCTLQLISEQNMVVFNTPGKQEMNIFYFSHLREGDNTILIFLSFILFSIQVGMVPFPSSQRVKTGCNLTQTTPQPLTVHKHCLFTQHKLILHLFLLHS